MGKVAQFRSVLLEAHALLLNAKAGAVDADELDRVIAKVEETTKRLARAPLKPKRGEGHFRARLNTTSVLEIRSLYASWKAAGSHKGYAELGDMFGVDWSTIRDVVKRRTWGHVD